MSNDEVVYNINEIFVLDPSHEEINIDESSSININESSSININESNPNSVTSDAIQTDKEEDEKKPEHRPLKPATPLLVQKRLAMFLCHVFNTYVNSHWITDQDQRRSARWFVMALFICGFKWRMSSVEVERNEWLKLQSHTIKIYGNGDKLIHEAIFSRSRSWLFFLTLSCDSVNQMIARNTIYKSQSKHEAILSGLKALKGCQGNLEDFIWEIKHVIDEHKSKTDSEFFINLMWHLE